MPVPRPVKRRLLSQGEVRPGMDQGQHWIDSVQQVAGAIEHLDRASELLQPSRRPGPSRRPNLALSNPVTR